MGENCFVLWYSIFATENISVASFPLTNTRDISSWVESFPLTNMRDISSWVESIASAVLWRRFYLTVSNQHYSTKSDIKLALCDFFIKNLRTERYGGVLFLPHFQYSSMSACLQ